MMRTIKYKGVTFNICNNTLYFLPTQPSVPTGRDLSNLETLTKVLDQYINVIDITKPQQLAYPIKVWLGEKLQYGWLVAIQEGLSGLLYCVCIGEIMPNLDTDFNSIVLTKVWLTKPEPVVKVWQTVADVPAEAWGGWKKDKNKSDHWAGFLTPTGISNSKGEISFASDMVWIPANENPIGATWRKMETVLEP